MPLAAIHGASRVLLATFAGVLAGIANGIAGGGSFFSFPILLALGLPALTANVTSSVGVLPSYLGGIAGFRSELSRRRDTVLALSPVTIVGALVGTALLLSGTSSEFRAVVPWLIGFATLAFAFQPLLVRLLRRVPHDHPRRRALLQAGTFLVAVYGGYFGAGVGILLLAVFGLALPDDLGTLSGLRNAVSLLMNLTAAVVFVVRGHLVWEVVFCLWAGTLVGGFLGTGVVKRLAPGWLRAVIVLMGAATTVRLLV